MKIMVLERAPGPPGGLRGEILQPNGQQILETLGLLHRLPANGVHPVRVFNFCRVGGERLCTIDYDMLPPPYNRAIVTLPNVVHHVILDALEETAPGALRYGTTFKGLVRDGGRVVGVDVESGGQQSRVLARLVVGADGALSQVREALGIQTSLYRYPEGYLIGLLDNQDGLTESRYFVGHKTILGVFPATSGKVYLFYMIPADSMPQIQARGLEPLRQAWTAIEPSLARTFAGLHAWTQTAYMPTGRVKTTTWVADGAVLLGDAAHAMNPHASQGRMQAMVDAMALADLIPGWVERDTCSAQALSVYEQRRRPYVEMLQGLADEQVVFWNTGNPVLAFLRDRVFRTLDRNARLRYAVLMTTAGFRTTRPFGLLDRVIAAGFLPDPRANQLPSDAGSVGAAR
jgi:2-polyprenyl-6-methoxyphenol hydroxylase-like FAD-dependent oxidoreductase